VVVADLESFQPFMVDTLWKIQISSSIRTQQSHINNNKNHQNVQVLVTSAVLTRPNETKGNMIKNMVGPELEISAPGE
jgi:hypothetical protein